MKLLIVDDHSVLREGLSALLKQSNMDATVLLAKNASEGLAALDAHPDLDLVLLDLILPGVEGDEAIVSFGRKRPALPVVVFSSSEDPEDVRRAMAAGALGYVPKSANYQVLLSAIRLVLNGDLYVPTLMLNDFGGGSAPAQVPLSRQRPLLTGRQIEILALLSRGDPNKSISRSLGLSEKTVKTHITAIFRALNVTNRTQAAAVGRKSGLI